MSADTFYAIGSSHQVCQDYAISNERYVIVSDGCSSVKDSDWGARLLTKACETIIRKKIQPFSLFIEQEDIANVTHLASEYCFKLNLNLDCLAATLLSAYIGGPKNEHIKTFIMGDGYVVARNKNDGQITVISHMFETGAPYYLYYNLSDNLRKSYLDNFGQGKLIIETSIYKNDKKIGGHETSYNCIVGGNLNSHDFRISEYDAVAVISDGLKTFSQQTKTNTSITTKSLDVYNVVKDLFSFKSTEGQFVHRRCQRVMRDYAIQNIKHTDDFAIGVIYILGVK